MSTPASPAVVRRPLAAPPQRVLRFSAGHYYDAAASGADVDFGAWTSGQYEDLHFNGPTRQIVLGRLRREARNNPYLAGLSAKYPDAIGTSCLRSRTSSPAYNDAKEKFVYRWSKHCTADNRSLRKVERINTVEQLHAGEMFVVLLRSGQFQLVASEFCGSPSGASRFGENELNGIVYDDAHRPVAYRFGRMTRWGRIQWTGTDEELVPARFVIHVHDPDRLLLNRALPWLLPSVRTFRDLYEITRSKTKQIKDANSLSGFIEKEGAAKFLQGLNPEVSLPEDAAAETADSPADPQPTEQTIIELKPGMFIGLNPGEKVNNLLSEYHATDYKELIMLMLHAGSAPVGLPVELWFSGLGDVNYSGFKGLGVQWKGRRTEVCKTIEETFLEPLFAWRTELAHDRGELPAAPADEEDLAEWGWKRAAVLDDEKSAKSNQIRLQTGEVSLADVWAENGEFPDEVLLKRRQLWIELQIQAGELERGADHSTIKVPIGFLLRGELPGTTTYPNLPDGTGTPEAAANAGEDGDAEGEEDDDAEKTEKDEDDEDDDAAA